MAKRELIAKEDAIKMAKADLKCMERDTSGQDEMCNSHKCDECSLNYERGNIGEQKEWLRLAIKALEQERRWIPVKTRPLTDAETADMLENSNFYYTYMFDCRLPENGEEVLVTTSTGEVTTTTFYDEGLDGCYFEFYEDDGDVIAWMPKPKAYKAESEG